MTPDPVGKLRRLALRSWGGALAELQRVAPRVGWSPGPGDPIGEETERRSTADEGTHRKATGARLTGPYRAAYDLAWSIDEELGAVLSPSGGAPSGRWHAAARRAAAAAAEIGELSTPSAEGRAARQERRNRFEVYWLVRGVRRHLDLPGRGKTFPLAPAITRALGHDAMRGLWLVEGLAHDWTIAEWQKEGPALTATWQDPQIPARLLPMLHAGLGLALAEIHLAPVAAALGTPSPGAAADPRALGCAIERFVDDCRHHALAPYRAIAVEALGLVARCFFPVTARPLIDAIAPGDSLFSPFWHGLGRAAYFLPIGFLPGFGGVIEALSTLRRSWPFPEAREAAETGFGYALALVNLDHPEVLEWLVGSIGRHGQRTGSDRGALVRGMAEAMAARQAITPGTGVLARLHGHRPATHRRRWWRDWVAAPAQALEEGSCP